MFLNRLKHVSFDLDGTLIDSIPAMKFAWEFTMHEIGLTVPFFKYARYIGLPFNVILARLELTELQSEITSIYFAKSLENSDEVRLIDGAQEIISHLETCGISTSIITSKPRENAEYFCKKTDLIVNELICGDDFTRGKPHQEPGHKLLSKLNINCEEVMYVGDMIFDFQFASNCDFDFVHFQNKGTNKMPENLLNNIKAIDELVELKNYL